jgi:HKD family nuclease
MKLEVVPNKGPASMGPELSRGLSWAKSLDIATAFLTVRSLERLEEALMNAQDSGRLLRIRLLCGLYQRFTSAATIRAAVRLQKKYSDQFHIRIARNNRFHWKLYLLHSNAKSCAYVGSANFTEDGLTASGELLRLATRYSNLCRMSSMTSGARKLIRSHLTTNS